MKRKLLSVAIIIAVFLTHRAAAAQYEAEAATLSGGAKSIVDGFANNTTAQASFPINVASAGTYTVVLRYTAGSGTSTNTGLYVNGVKIKNISCAATANWDTWADETETVTLNAGNNTIAYKAETSSGSCIKLDYISVNAVSTDPCAGIQGGGAGLKGTVFGLNPPWAAGSEYCKATDGNINTYYDYSQANGAYTGLDLGSAQVIGKIRYYPRATFAARMTGGKFQGSNTSNSSGFVDLYTIATTPAVQWNEVTISNSTGYRWVRYLAPANGYGNIAEVEFYAALVIPQDGKYEIENATLSGSAAKNTNHSGYSGASFVDGLFNSTTAQASLVVTVASAGNYGVKTRYSAGNGASTNTGLYINGVKIKNITCPGTGNWDTWANEVEMVALNAGNNTISYKAETSSSSCINLDYVKVYSWGAGDLSEFDWRDAIVYNILVDRFFDGDPSNNSTVSGVSTALNFQGGDIAGVQSKIEEGYLADLGVNTLLLSSVMANTHVGYPASGGSSSAYLGGWPLGTTSVDANYGDSASLKTLVSECHSRDIKVLSNYQAKYIHSQAPVYSAHSDWFNIGVCGGTGDACTSGCYTTYLPSFIYTIPAAKTWSLNLASQWAKSFGFDGYYLECLKDSPKSWFSDFQAQTKVNMISSFGGKYLLNGDIYYSTDINEQKSWMLSSAYCDGISDWPLCQKIHQAFFQKAIPMSGLSVFSVGDQYTIGNDTAYGVGAPIFRSVSLPGVPRPIDRAETGNDFMSLPFDTLQPTSIIAYDLLALAYAFVFTSPGVPYVRYGDEVGMAGGPNSQDKDRFMQWSEWSGLTSNQQTLLGKFSKLASIRSANKALSRGSRTTLSSSADTWVYRMGGVGSNVPDIIIALNRADASNQVTIPSGNYVDLMTGATATGGAKTVPARGFIIYKSN